jgi:hypothetical protein
VIEVYVHVEARLEDGSVEHRIYNWNPYTQVPCWDLGHTVVDGDADEAKAIVSMLNNQFNIEINN